MTLRFKTTTRQLPVGQGGMMLTVIERQDGAAFRFVFDCGSLNREHLQQGMESVELAGLEVLFISHLDQDHVNGVDALLTRAPVDTVVLPGLDALSITATAALAADCEALSGNLIQLLQDPFGWLGSRGVKRVITVSRPPGGDSPGPWVPDLLPGGDDGNQKRDDQPFELRMRGNGRLQEKSRIGESGIEVQQLDPAGLLYLDLGWGGHQWMQWLLLPYYNPFEQVRVDAFRKAVKDVLNVPDDCSIASVRFRDKLVKVLRNSESRERLRSCYDHLSSRRNAPSLSLYSGPARNQHFWICTSRWPNGWSLNGKAGWLTTGDAELGRETMYAPWRRRFEPLLPQVAVFVLTHHGSKASVHERLLSGLRGATALVCAAKGRKHHPDPTVPPLVRRSHLGFAQVSEQSDSEFWLTVENDPLP
ncbi:hypothetical protein [Ramlibacter sp.]|uniref:hypothetical protein n=1 Tax=Ramlibacter sp. TaxID=1917967 RepID=UPI003D12D9E3